MTARTRVRAVFHFTENKWKDDPIRKLKSTGRAKPGALLSLNFCRLGL